MKLKVVEKFISINGEGRLSGQLAVFIRFAGCNLNCSYCDTSWANEKNVPYTLMTPEEIYEYVKATGINNLTLTGGEPLLQEDFRSLLDVLSLDNTLRVEIETNGSASLHPFLNIKNPPSFTMDYKLPSSKMENKMLLSNFEALASKDTVKFVCGSLEDLEKARFIIDKYNLVDKVNIYLSPVFGEIELNCIVEFMKNNRMNGITLQLQLHKIIWDPKERGV